MGDSKNGEIMKENTHEKRDDLAAIGIGAMIVFIALILVAAVAAAVIISTAEKLQQNAQNTGAETTDMLSSKVVVLSIMVVADAGGDNLYLTFELAPGSSNIAPGDIDYSIVCSNGAVYGTFSQTSLVGTDGTLPLNTLLEPHVTYDLTMSALDIADCPPTANDDHSLAIQSKSGGYTFETLNYGSDVSSGAVVV